MEGSNIQAQIEFAAIEYKSSRESGAKALRGVLLTVVSTSVQTRQFLDSYSSVFKGASTKEIRRLIEAQDFANIKVSGEAMVELANCANESMGVSSEVAGHFLYSYIIKAQNYNALYSLTMEVAMNMINLKKNPTDSIASRNCKSIWAVVTNTMVGFRGKEGDYIAFFNN